MEFNGADAITSTREQEHSAIRYIGQYYICIIYAYNLLNLFIKRYVIEAGYSILTKIIPNISTLSSQHITY